MNIIDLPSPNFDERGAPVDMLVLHYTDTESCAEAIACLTDETPGKRVSAHYVVDEDGTVYRMVPEDKRAWHAGVSHWRGHDNINARSIGIEIVNPGHSHGYRAFPEAQMEAVTRLCKDILTRHAIPARNVVGHSDIAPARKRDPGELFPWEWLAGLGVGLWPAPSQTHRGNLAAYGYDCSDMNAAITAFQRHFRPQNLSGEWDAECQSLLNGLLAATL